MTDENWDESQKPYDPGSMATSSLSSAVVIWYKRPWFLVTLGIIVVLAVSVISDLPRDISVDLVD